MHSISVDEQVDDVDSVDDALIIVEQLSMYLSNGYTVKLVLHKQPGPEFIRTIVEQLILEYEMSYVLEMVDVVGESYAVRDQIYYLLNFYQGLHR